MTADPSADWVDEGQEIPVSDADFDEVSTAFHKLAGLTIITAELAADSNPEASQAIGDGLARDMSRRVDGAFFGSLTAPAPAGLGSLTVTEVPAGSAITNTDPFNDGLHAAEQAGARVDSWVANPDDVLALSKVKKATGSNEPLMAWSPDSPTGRAVVGRPLFPCVDVPAGTLWGIPRNRCFLVVREDAEIETDSSVFFTSDRVAVRGKLRVGLLFPHPAALVKLTIA